MDLLTLGLIAGAAYALIAMRSASTGGGSGYPEGVTESELIRSGTASREGIDNSPTPTARQNLQALSRAILAPLRQSLAPRVVSVTSGYRSPELNTRIGGSSRSQHTKGEAIDITASGLTARELAQEIDGLNLPYDQLIYYAPSRGGHVHVSHKASGNRKQVLYAPSEGGYERARL